MQWTGLNELREKYLSFFESKGHLRLDSFPLVPKNDPSLLLINSGMAPMKKWFLAQEEPPRHRVTTCQKCIRTPDIERVGITARHGTFFEMLGNFSFQDYFKEEVIPWAWEFLTSDEWMAIPKDRLHISVYEEDDEAYDIWTKKVGIAPDHHMVRLGKEDNFWEHGSGPCGPCSEIYFDRGPEYGCGKPTCGVGCDCDRYMEIWNLVFSQFDADGKGHYERLARPNIDTGMGLERLACVMQNVGNLFEVDTVQSVLHHVEHIANKTYGEKCQDRYLHPCHHRPHPQLHLHGVRWHPAFQRGPRLCAAPPAAPCCPPWPYAGHHPPVPGGAGGDCHPVQRDRIPRAARARCLYQEGHRHRGGKLCPHH